MPLTLLCLLSDRTLLYLANKYNVTNLYVAMNSGAFVGVFSGNSSDLPSKIPISGSAWEVETVMPLRRNFFFRTMELESSQYVLSHSAPLDPFSVMYR